MVEAIYKLKCVIFCTQKHWYYFYFVEESINISLNFPLDVLTVVPRDSHMYSIPSLLLDSAVYQLNQVKECLLEQSEVKCCQLLRVKFKDGR